MHYSFFLGMGEKRKTSFLSCLLCLDTFFCGSSAVLCVGTKQLSIKFSSKHNSCPCLKVYGGGGGKSQQNKPTWPRILNLLCHVKFNYWDRTESWALVKTKETPEILVTGAFPNFCHWAVCRCSQCLTPLHAKLYVGFILKGSCAIYQPKEKKGRKGCKFSRWMSGVPPQWVSLWDVEIGANKVMRTLIKLMSHLWVIIASSSLKMEIIQELQTWQISFTGVFWNSKL